MNYQDLELFLQFLAPNEPVTVSFFSSPEAGKEEIIRGLGVFHGTYLEIVEKLEYLLAPGSNYRYPTVHVTINKTNFLGRKLTNIVSPRVLCVDLDSVTSRERIKEIATLFNPGLIVESSPQKFHIYWKLSDSLQDITHLKDWEFFQLALAQFLNGDYTLSQVSHTIRMPGCERLTKTDSVTPFTPAIVFYAPDNKPIESWDEVRAVLGGETNANALVEAAHVSIRAARRALRQAMTTREGAISTFGQGRNTALYSLLKSEVSNITKPSDDISYVTQLASEINSQFQAGPLPDEELKHIVESAFERGLAVREKRNSKLNWLLSSTMQSAGDDIAVSITNIGHDDADVATQVVGNTNGTNGTGTNGNGHEYVNGHAHTGHLLNGAALMDTGPVQSAHKFSELSIIEKIVAHHGDKLVRVGSAIYAFSTHDNVWRLQDRQTPTELLELFERETLDVLSSEEFARTYAVTKDGAVSEEKLNQAKLKFLSARTAFNAIKAVPIHGGIRRSDATIFDADDRLLFTGDGLVLNMVTGETRPPVCRDYLLGATPVQYDSSAECPGWLQFLSDIFSLNEKPLEMVSFLQRIFGYSLGSSIDEQKIFCHFGDGCNGKSKVLSALLAITGDYGSMLGPDDLVSKKAGFKFERIATKLQGKRCVIVDDMDTASVWNEAFVKGLTSSNILARALYQESRVVANRAKIHIGLNAIPQPESESYGLIRRICLVPYAKQFESSGYHSERIDRLIQDELSGILNWAIAGYRERIKRRGEFGDGLLEPGESDVALQEYRTQHFIGDEIIKQLFEVTDDRDQWLSPSDILTTVNNAYQSRGSSQRVSRNRVASLIKSIFKVEVTTAWNADKGYTTKFYPVKLKLGQIPTF
jgi:P4 family phage/plasmid primase-like protien